ncbi:uncharacterized protein LOC144114812 [Amblyomma americanum]
MQVTGFSSGPCSGARHASPVFQTLKTAASVFRMLLSKYWTQTLFASRRGLSDVDLSAEDGGPSSAGEQESGDDPAQTATGKATPRHPTLVPRGEAPPALASCVHGRPASLNPFRDAAVCHACFRAYHPQYYSRLRSRLSPLERRMERESHGLRAGGQYAALP